MVVVVLILLVLAWSRVQGPYHGMGVGAVNMRSREHICTCNQDILSRIETRPLYRLYTRIEVIGPTRLEGSVQIIICGLWHFCLRGDNFLAMAPGIMISYTPCIWDHLVLDCASIEALLYRTPSEVWICANSWIGTLCGLLPMPAECRLLREIRNIWQPSSYHHPCPLCSPLGLLLFSVLWSAKHDPNTAVSRFICMQLKTCKGSQTQSSQSLSNILPIASGSTTSSNQHLVDRFFLSDALSRPLWNVASLRLQGAGGSPVANPISRFNSFHVLHVILILFSIETCFATHWAADTRSWSVLRPLELETAPKVGPKSQACTASAEVADKCGK